jgi:hypothetical protein
MGFKGHGLCGAVAHESRAEPMAFMLCHCRDCQDISGGEPATAVVIPKPDGALPAFEKQPVPQSLSSEFVARVLFHTKTR